MHAHGLTVGAPVRAVEVHEEGQRPYLGPVGIVAGVSAQSDAQPLVVVRFADGDVVQVWSDELVPATPAEAARA